MDLKELLSIAISQRASDLHLTENSSPVLRINGKLIFLNQYQPLLRDDLKRTIYSVLSDLQKEKFERDRELDFSLSMEGFERFRVNVHIQRGSVEAAFRRIPLYVPSTEDLALPPVITELARRPDGLVLVTGPTGSGKTTTLAAMIDLINRERSCMIVAIEDPIEYLHRNKKAVIKQREVYSDTLSFSEALKRCLRQDPDVIVVGEMRDLETIGTTLTAAETGHLVLATLHTPDAAQTIERIIDVFPAHQQQQVRLQLSASLQGVVCQRLLPSARGDGRVLVTEVLMATLAVRNLIREKAVEQIPTAMQTGMQFGMHTMDSCLRDLFEQGLITFEDALAQVKNVQEFQHLVQHKNPKRR